MTPEQLGQRAAEMLNDPFTTEMLGMIEQTLTQSWKIATDTAAREEAWYTLKGHQRFINTLEVLRDNAKFEKALEESNT